MKTILMTTILLFSALSLSEEGFDITSGKVKGLDVIKALIKSGQNDFEKSITFPGDSNCNVMIHLAEDFGYRETYQFMNIIISDNEFNPKTSFYITPKTEYNYTRKEANKSHPEGEGFQVIDIVKIGKNVLTIDHDGDYGLEFQIKKGKESQSCFIGW